MDTATLTSTFAKQMCEDVGPHQHHDIQLLEFAHHVWGLDPQVGRQILDMNIKLDPQKLHAYRRSGCERDLHAPFVDFAELLHSEVISRLDTPGNIITDCFWKDKDTGKDVVMTWRAQRPADDTTPTLCGAKHILEFRHDRYKDTGSLLSQPDKARIAQTFSSGSHRRPKAPIVPPRVVNSERKASPEPESQSETELPVSHSETCSKKRQRGTSNSSSVTYPPTKRGRFYDKAQLLTYAIECLAVTSRRWVTGLLIDTCEVTACYFDRHMVACSSSFRFDRNPAMLALVLYAMNLCDRDRAGFDPHHLNSPVDPSLPAGSRSDSTPPVSQLIGSFFDFTLNAKADGIADNCGGLEREDCLEENDPLQKCDTGSEGNQKEYLLRSVGQADVESSQFPYSRESSYFRVGDVIRQPDDLVGRGAAVYKVQRRLSSGESGSEVYALKFSWALKSRVSEIDIIEHLRTALPASSHDHLPDLIFSKSWTAKQLRLPWLDLELTLNEKNHQERILRAFASKHYKKLWEAGSVDNFKQAWLDCVEVCYLAFRLGKVLHRDLSENNIMVLPLPDGKAKGVLNDWDMAKFIHDHADPILASAHGTGTPPFMATDLLRTEWMQLSQDQLPPHWFRHDLESLFYILIWAAIHYNLEEATRDSDTHPFVLAWTKGDAQNHESKFTFLTGGLMHEKRLLSAIKPEFEQVVKEWVIPLRKLFKKAIFLGTDMEEEDDFDFSTYGGELTFKTFMKTINVTPRSWGIPNVLDGDD